ncbi:hypothetical protein OAO62_01450 [Gammaproteobacteria bacterium]|nr:hypothetical protein [Gammaproteobacteria bacterium]
MNRKQFLIEKTKKEILALRQNKCWVHGDDLIRGITEPSYGLPSGYHSEIQRQFPYHGLFVDLGCLAVPSDQIQGETTNICSTCQKEAIVFLDCIENEEEE